MKNSGLLEEELVCKSVYFGEQDPPEHVECDLHCRNTMELADAIQTYAVPMIIIDNSRQDLIGIIEKGCDRAGYPIPEIRVDATNDETETPSLVVTTSSPHSTPEQPEPVS